MHPCNFDTTLIASPKILVLNFFLPHHQAQDKKGINQLWLHAL